jgi:hypothetical protein
MFAQEHDESGDQQNEQQEVDTEVSGAVHVT